ncbi:MAG TPA: hypothetical protein VLE27_07180 [Thermoanaerobaculia bacterium]|nr:hypothetical protein [Thermoanaerobaculia bacterium]
MKLWRAVAIVLGLLLWSGLPAAAAELPRLEIEAPAALEPTAQRLRAMDPGQIGSAVRLVGLEEPGPPIRVILAPEGSEAAERVPPWVSGYAFGEMGLIVLLPQRVPAYPDSSLEDLLRHEVAHVLVARASGGRPLPRWFHEGMAMIAGLSWGFDDRSRLSLALLTDQPVSLAALDDRFNGTQAEVNRAYAISGAFVRELFESYGPRAAPEILAGVARGLSFEEAFRTATGVSLAEAEESFWENQTFWYRWVPVLTSSVTLWLLVTLLAVWAIRRRRQRDAAIRRGWEEDEERLRLAAEARESGEAGPWVH